jgi:hypothetical protein
MNRRYATSVSAVVDGALSRTPTVNMLSYSMVGKGMVRVICDVIHTSESRENHELVAASIKNKLQGKLEPVLGSFSSVDKGPFSERITGVVAAIKESFLADESTMKGFTSLAANMFIDEERDMWVLRKSKAGNLLVKANGVEDALDLINLMEGLCSMSAHGNSAQHRNLMSQSSVASKSAKGGDFVSYVNAENQLAFGFVVASVLEEPGKEAAQSLILPTDAADAEVVDNAAIVDVEDQDSLPEVEMSEQEHMDDAVAAARGSSSVQVLLDYYKRVYARRPKFYEQFAARIRQHAFV